MYFTATIQAYDALTEIVWVATVREWTGSDTEAQDTLVLRVHGQAPGEGLENPRTWLRSVLEDARESL